MSDFLLPLKQHVINELCKHLYGTFGVENPEHIKAFDFENRFRIVADTEMFNYKESKEIWDQQKGNTAKIYQVYFDGEHMGNFDENTHFKVFLLTFFRTFKEKYTKGTIKLIKDDYRIEYEVKKAQEQDSIKEIEAIKATTPEEKMAKQIVLNVTKDKKKKGKHAMDLAT